jgi:aminopeptidase
MIDPDALAALLCDYCLEVAVSQQVLAASTTLAEPLLGALHRAILARGAWPIIRIERPEQREEFYEFANERQLNSFPSVALAEIEQIDSHVRIEAPANLRALSSVDPERITRALSARAPLSEAQLAKPWCGTLWPTPALAQQAGMSEREYRAFVNRALFLDRGDAVEAWRELSRRQQQLVDRLASVSEIRIEADGTDLKLRVEGRTWINSDGHRNMPSGEVFTGPLERSANGTIRFTIPSLRAVEVEEVELRFRDGEVVAASARRGAQYLQSALQTDSGARLLGEIGIGTNSGIDRPTGSTLLDEKIAGTVHLALGRSYPETGGTNRSALHWDLICDLRAGGCLSADGEPLHVEQFTSA